MCLLRLGSSAAEQETAARCTLGHSRRRAGLGAVLGLGLRLVRLIERRTRARLAKLGFVLRGDRGREPSMIARRPCMPMLLLLSLLLRPLLLPMLLRAPLSLLLPLPLRLGGGGMRALRAGLEA